MNGKIVTILGVLLIGLVSLAPIGQTDEVKIATTPVTNQIYMITGHGGNLKAMITAVDKILPLADNDTKIIAGHGPLGDKKQLTRYRQMLMTAYERLRKLKAEGKGAQEAAAVKPLADLEATWGDGMFKSDRWIELIYPGV